MDENTNEKIKEKVRSSLLYRNVLGALGMLLPVFSIIGGFAELAFQNILL